MDLADVACSDVVITSVVDAVVDAVVVVVVVEGTVVVGFFVVVSGECPSGTFCPSEMKWSQRSIAWMMTSKILVH